MKKVSVFRREHFNAAHRLHNDAWSDEKNKSIFGKCNNANYHGHNYELIIKLTGHVDPETGYLYDLGILSDLVKKNVLEVLDHQNLNLDVPHFKKLNPTAEHIAYVIYEILRPLIEEKIDLNITLFETPRNYVEYPG